MKLGMAPENDARISEALRTPGGHLSIGRGGYALYFNGSSRLQGYDCDQMKEACIACGLPVIDSRTVPFDVVWDLAVKGPMVAVVRPLTVMTIQDLENLEQSVNAFSFVQLLDDYARECPDRMRSLHNFIAFSAYGPKILPSPSLIEASTGIIDALRQELFPDNHTDA